MGGVCGVVVVWVVCVVGGVCVVGNIISIVIAWSNNIRTGRLCLYHRSAMVYIRTGYTNDL